MSLEASGAQYFSGL